MLSNNPKMLPRLDELEARHQHAVDEGWRGEVGGLDLTLRFLASKRAQAHRAAATATVDLGMPPRPGARAGTEQRTGTGGLRGV
ncbi:hypothetical protein [Streptomyces umbrinus]|uniref:hypothetical protein n=1 Tax=Streptomyces umbrinus TaxID=67370 RepID=UPI003433C99C